MPRPPPCPSEYGFILDDMPSVQVEEVWVPMTEDYFDWRCKVVGV